MIPMDWQEIQQVVKSLKFYHWWLLILAVWLGWLWWVDIKAQKADRRSRSQPRRKPGLRHRTKQPGPAKAKKKKYQYPIERTMARWEKEGKGFDNDRPNGLNDITW